VSLALQAARRIAAPGLGESDRNRYLSAVDGVAYGEDPADGVVRGRRFMHPRLGVAFDAPEGLTLENTSRAVLGASTDGQRRLLFDAVEMAEGQSLAGLIQTTWSDAVETDTIENSTVNGLPVALASSRGKEWSFRLAAIRVGGTTYRLVYATRRLDAEMERVFRATLESVRALGAEEARSLRPLRLATVTASEGDTVETLAARMVVPDRAVERFMIVNGLEKAGRLTPGARYKIVVQ
jgi:predicted Zn-dependent protease